VDGATTFIQLLTIHNTLAVAHAGLSIIGLLIFQLGRKVTFTLSKMHLVHFGINFKISGHITVFSKTDTCRLIRTYDERITGWSSEAIKLQFFSDVFVSSCLPCCMECRRGL